MKHMQNWDERYLTQDDAEKIAASTGVDAPPCLSAQEMIEVVDPLFELIEMRRCEFPLHRNKQGKAIFNAWGSVFRKRIVSRN